MPNLTDISYIRSLLGAADTGFKKRFGQNFLVNPTVPKKIAEAGIPSPDFGVLEIGPGIGTLTVELAARSRKVVAVEIDASLLPILSRTLAECPNTEVVNADAQKIDLAALCAEKFTSPKALCAGVCVCANLPYYITTPILMKLLECREFSRITVMVQSEVADRLTAIPGSAEYGAITASIAYRGICKKVLSVSAGSFLPAPNVDSAVVSIELYREKAHTVSDEKTLFRVIRGAFGQRRKTLINALAAEFPEIGKERLSVALKAAETSPDIRGERLGIAEFCSIADQLAQRFAKQLPKE